MFSLNKTPMDKAENAVLKLFSLHSTPEAKFQSLSEVGNLLHHIDCQQSLAACLSPFLAGPRAL